MKLDNRVTTHMVLKYNKKINKKLARGQAVPNQLTTSFHEYLELAKSKLNNNLNEIKEVNLEVLDTQTEFSHLVSKSDTDSQ